MGWFAVAAIFGFLLFWVWRDLSRTDFAAAHNRLGVLIRHGLPLFATVLLAIGLFLWIWLFTDSASIGDVVDAIGRGTVARGLLGIVVGFGLGYAIEHRILVAASASKPSEKGKGTEPAGGTSALLTVGFGAVILALAAPHLDFWLSHLSSFKSPVIELQLGSVAAHKVSVTEGSAELNDADSLKNLATYSRAIQADIAFAKQFDPKNEAQLKDTQELLPAFVYLISPIAGCVQTAIGNGLSTEIARRKIAPMAEELSEIIFNADSKNASKHHAKFWALLETLPSEIQGYLKDKKAECLSYPQQYRDCLQKPEMNEAVCRAYNRRYGGRVSYPEYQNHRNVPYLYVAASQFFSFMTDDDTALRILDTAEQNVDAEGKKQLKFMDYSFLLFTGQLTYYLGRPGPLAKSYYPYLERMRQTAGDRVVMLQSKLAACTDAACKTLMENFLLRHWNAELSATNQLTYYLAEDLARNSAYALPYIGRIEEFSGWLKRATDVGTQSDAQTKYYAVDDDYKYYLRDTYLYADMVLEARKANPSVDHFKKLKHDFEQIVEHVEESKADVPNLRKVDLTLVKIAHAHYASARDLAGE